MWNADRAALLLVLLLTLCTGRTWAEVPARAGTPAGKAVARAAYNEGQRLVAAKDYRRALSAFKRGYLAYEDPVFLFNMAQCHRLLVEREEAVRYYRAFLERVPNPSNLAEVQSYLSRLDMEMEAERTRVAEPQGAEPAPRSADEIPAEPVPVYKKWWVWTLVGVVVVGGALGIGLGLGLRPPPSFNATLPDFGPSAMAPTRAIVELSF